MRKYKFFIWTLIYTIIVIIVSSNFKVFYWQTENLFPDSETWLLIAIMYGGAIATVAFWVWVLGYRRMKK